MCYLSYDFLKRCGEMWHLTYVKGVKAKVVECYRLTPSGMREPYVIGLKPGNVHYLYIHTKEEEISRKFPHVYPLDCKTVVIFKKSLEEEYLRECVDIFLKHYSQAIHDKITYSAKVLNFFDGWDKSRWASVLRNTPYWKFVVYWPAKTAAKKIAKFHQDLVRELENLAFFSEKKKELLASTYPYALENKAFVPVFKKTEDEEQNNVYGHIFPGIYLSPEKEEITGDGKRRIMWMDYPQRLYDWNSERYKAIETMTKKEYDGILALAHRPTHTGYKRIAKMRLREQIRCRNENNNLFGTTEIKLNEKVFKIPPFAY